MSSKGLQLDYSSVSKRQDPYLRKCMLTGFAELRQKLDKLARSQDMEKAFEYDAANNSIFISGRTQRE